MKKKISQCSRILTLLILTLLLAACSQAPHPPTEPATAGTEEATALPTVKQATTAAPGTAEAVAATHYQCGDKSKLSKQLNLFNWSDYIDPNVLTQFEKECGVKVIQDFYSSNEDMVAKIQAGNSGYDVVIPSDYAVQMMIKSNLLAELDKSNIPNVKNLNPDNMGLYYDPENKYSLPYQWGTSGIAYNAKAFPAGPPDSWAVLFDPAQVCKHKGRVSMVDDEREVIGAALKYLGYSYNDTDPAHHEQAKKILLAQKECLAGYNTDNYNQTLASEEVVLAHAWGGTVAVARAENENIFFVTPKEGASIYQDNMVIPKDAPHKYTAEIFINYILEPEIGAQISNYIYYFTPNKAAEPFLDFNYYKLLKSGRILIDNKTRSRLEWIKRDDKSVIFSDTWTAVKAQ